MLNESESFDKYNFNLLKIKIGCKNSDILI